MQIVKRGKIWHGRITKSDGKRTWRSLKTPDKKIAQLRYAQLLNMHDTSGFLDVKKRIPTQDALQEYFVQNTPFKEPNTISKERYVLNKFFRTINVPRIDMIDGNIIQNYLNGLIESGLSKVTANDALKHIKSMFNWMRKRKLVQNNPCQDVSAFKAVQKIPVFLEIHEIDQLLHAAEGTALYGMILCGLHTGLRFSELARLEWEDVDMGKRIVFVRNKEYKSTKTKQERSVNISQKLYDYLSLAAKKKGAVFPNADGGHFLSRPKRTLKAIVEKSKIKKRIGFHTLRHTFASQLVMAGVDLTTVSRLMGHSSIKTTMIYAHLSDQHKKTAIDKLPY